MIEVLRAGPLTTVQDLGRPGYAHLGVPRSGALDQAALRRANALVGNSPAAAGLETTLLGCRLRFTSAAIVAVTGAAAVVKVDGAVVSGVAEVAAGAVVDVGRATAGVRSYVAVRGGVGVPAVLGSRSTDTLSGLGPPRLTDGMTMPIGDDRGPIGDDRGPIGDDRGPIGDDRGPIGDDGGPVADGRGAAGGVAPDVRRRADLDLDVRLGPRDDWFAPSEVFGGEYRISLVSNRVGARLDGPPLTRIRDGELPPEGLVLGAVQVPADGQPLIFLADHPTTGGYPVIGVVDDVTALAQARPGTVVRFHEHGGAW